MNIVTLAMAKAYTNSQRLGHVESKRITYDGKSEKIDMLGGNANTVAKISDEPFDLSTVCRLYLKFRDGMEIAVEKESITIYAEGGIEFIGNNTALIFCMSVPENNDVGLPAGLYVADGFDENGDEFYVPRIETETIVPIDPKYLPGVCLPVVELSTTVASGAVFTAEENAKLTAAFAEGVPIVLNCSLDSQGEGIKAESFAGVAYRAISDVMNMFVLYMGQTFVIMSEDCLNWVAGIE